MSVGEGRSKIFNGWEEGREVTGRAWDGLGPLLYRFPFSSSMLLVIKIDWIHESHATIKMS